MPHYYETVVQHLRAKKIHFSENGKQDAVFFSVAGENGHWGIRVQIFEEMERVLIVSSPGVPCPENRRVALSEFLNRINSGLMQGNFDLDMNDGQTRFRTCLECSGQTLSESHLDLFFCLHFTTLDHYFSSLMRVIYGQLSAEEAFLLRHPPEREPQQPHDSFQRRNSSEQTTERRTDMRPTPQRERKEEPTEEELNRELHALLNALEDPDREQLAAYLQEEDDTFSTPGTRRKTSKTRREISGKTEAKKGSGHSPASPDEKRPQ